MRCAGLTGPRDGPSAVTAIMGVPTVGQVRTWAGLDVHAAKVVAAVVDLGVGGAVVSAA